MRIPLSWLREYAEVPADATAEDVMADLVRVGLEEEDVHRPSDHISGPIVVGEVLSIESEPQKNGKLINWCQVRVAEEGKALSGEGISPDGVQGIICGAHNFKVGDKVPVTLPGAVLPGDFRIGVRQTYGHTSAGMIASAKELGLGDDHEGIIVLSEWGVDLPVGTDLIPVFGLDDEAAEISITPDRGYAFSIRGVAREYALATGTSFTDPAAQVEPLPATSNGFPVELDDERPIRGNDGCDRFVACKVTNIDPTRPTPQWMASRLRLAGMRSISLVVDISNYVMWELGQPLHFYDAAKLATKIVVRRAHEGETLTTLDGKERKLHTEDLLITDASGPIGLAGVMGGLDTEVTENTTEVLIEAAHFDPVSMGRTRRRHKLPSEASKRNERGVDPAMAPIAAQRAAELLVELAGGTIEPDVTDVNNTPQPVTIELPLGFANKLMGVDYSDAQIREAILGFGGSIEELHDADGALLSYQVTIPTWRSDMRLPEDVVEEIGRLVGFEHIPSTLPVPPPGRGLTHPQRRRRQVMAGFADAGLTEVLNYPFVSTEENEQFAGGTLHSGAQLALANPIAQQTKFLRQSLLPGLLGAAKRNISRGFRDLALYESGLVFLGKEQTGSKELPAMAVKPSDVELAQLESGIPDQPRHLAAVLVGHVHTPTAGAEARAWDYADAIDLAWLAARLVGASIEIQQGAHPAFHPGRCAQVVLTDGTVIGFAGELHPAMLAEQDLPERTQALELNLEKLIDAAPETVAATGLVTFPASNQDVALIVPKSESAAAVQKTLARGAGELLEDIWLFDTYAGPGIEEDKKSLAFGMRFRAADRTLTADEVSAQREAAVALASQEHQAVLRG